MTPMKRDKILNVKKFLLPGVIYVDFIYDNYVTKVKILISVYICTCIEGKEINVWRHFSSIK